MFGQCSDCNCELEAVWFEEEEIKMEYGLLIKTGRKRNAVDYLVCPCCLNRYCVDDSFDGEWHR